MTTEERDELTRLRRGTRTEITHEANLLMIDIAKERLARRCKKKLRGDAISGMLKEEPGVKGNDEYLVQSLGYSKQAYYRGQRAGDKLERECYLLSIVQDIRRGHA